MDGLRELAAFLPEISHPGFVAGEVHHETATEPGIVAMPFVSLGPTASSLVDVAYKHDLVLKDFDWPQWMGSTEATDLRDRDVALGEASAEQLCRLLTVCIRQNRFVEGALLDAFESGLILRIVRRAATLASERGTG